MAMSLLTLIASGTAREFYPADSMKPLPKRSGEVVEMFEVEHRQ